MAWSLIIILSYSQLWILRFEAFRNFKQNVFRSAPRSTLRPRIHCSPCGCHKALHVSHKPYNTTAYKHQHFYRIMASFDLGGSPSDSLPKKMKNLSPETFFSSPVIDLTRSSSDSSRKMIISGATSSKVGQATMRQVAAASGSHCSSDSEFPDETKAVVIETKRKCKEIIEIASTSEEEDVEKTNAFASHTARKNRVINSSTIRTQDVENGRGRAPKITAIKRSGSIEEPITNPLREYFHARTNQPIASATDFQDDTDCEDADDWLHAISEKLIDDFDDVSEKEKKFMNLWNRFIKCHHVIADRDIPRKVESFIVMNREKLREGDLRINLLLHLSNLWDASLISSNRISSCMTIYDDGDMGTGGRDGCDQTCAICVNRTHESKHKSSSGRSSSI
jgi:hypothetical protein